MSQRLSQADSTLLSAQQQAQIKQLKDAWTAAHAAGDRKGEQEANRQAEAIRAQAGYQGGEDGSGYTALGQGAGASVPGAGQSAGDVQKWVDDYERMNYSPAAGWVNGFSSEMNLRSMANYIRQQMEANSQAWAGADREGRAWLHQQNQELAEILEKATGGAKSTFNEEKGRWETDNANLGYGYNVGQYLDPAWYQDIYGMTEEQAEAYRNDTDRYRNYVDQRVIRNWQDESSGYTGLYAQFVDGPYGQLLQGSKNVDPTVYMDVIGDGFHEHDYERPRRDAEGNFILKKPALKHNNSMTDYTRKLAAYVDENGVIQPGILTQTHPGWRYGAGPHGGEEHVTVLPGGTGFGGLDQWREDAGKQVVLQRDHGVDQAVMQLLQAQKEAESRYAAQRDQIAKEERNALDNSALYAETRGDRGGIGQSQYNQIQAVAAENRQLVNVAQSQLASDTARQIAQLRAEGEFGKADDLLEISQTYLLKLLQLEQWAAKHQLDREKFQESIRQWQYEFGLKAGRAMM